ncbi:MAG: hypothetical protein V4631_16970 [Pseudomonadota bacterium]
MKFSEDELKLIGAARKKSTDARVKRLLILFAIMIGIGLMIAGIVSADRIAYAAVAAVFLSIAMPQLGGGPKYEDLVKLLESKSTDISGEP